MKRKRILLSNDDGYTAKGIELLAQALSEFADVVVVAPEVNHSGASNSLTLKHPLMVRQASNGFYYVNGTPSDCVHIALTGLIHEPFDLVVSGINNGANLGEDTLYSGTVAAASEGYLFGYSAIAFSLAKRNWMYIESAVEVAVYIVKKELERQEKELDATPVLLSVNIPMQPEHDLDKIRVTRLGRRHPSQNVIPIQNPNGETMYWIGAVGDVKDAQEDTDFNAIRQGCVTITPISLDMTAYHQLQNVRTWFEKAQE